MLYFTRIKPLSGESYAMHVDSVAPHIKVCTSNQFDLRVTLSTYMLTRLTLIYPLIAQYSIFLQISGLCSSHVRLCRCTG